MGLEARCECEWQDETTTVRAHLDSTGLKLQGPLRVHVDLDNITAADPIRGALRLRTLKGVMVLHLGEKADTWARFIKHPRSRIDKLGVRPRHRVLLVGLEDPALEAELESRNCTVLRRESNTPVDSVMILVETREKLRLILRYRKTITQDGSIWVIRPKGKDTRVTEAQVRDAGERASLVNVKVVSFSATHSAEKLVIPLANRES